MLQTSRSWYLEGRIALIFSLQQGTLMQGCHFWRWVELLEIAQRGTTEERLQLQYLPYWVMLVALLYLHSLNSTACLTTAALQCCFIMYFHTHTHNPTNFTVKNTS